MIVSGFCRFGHLLYPACIVVVLFLKHSSCHFSDLDPGKNINNSICIWIHMASHNFSAFSCTLCTIGNRYRDSNFIPTLNDLVLLTE